MQTPPERPLGLREERVRRLTAAVPYLLLFVSTVLALLTGGGDRGERLETLALAVFTAALVWTATGLFPEWASRPVAMAAYLTCLVVLIAVLSAHSTWFAGFFAFTGYVHSWHLLRGAWRYVGVTATATVSITAYMGGPPEPTLDSVLLYLVFTATIVVVVSVFSHFGEITVERSTERERMVERLRGTIRENEGLHAQLLVQAREAGVHDERQRMAREIHDTLAQGLAGVIAQLQAAERSREADKDPSVWRARVSNATRLARESLAEARRSVHALGPAPLEEATLSGALAEVTSEWSALHGVHAEFTVTGTARPLHTEAAAALLRAGQEALANVAKHAGARRVGVTLSYMEDRVTLDVRDDGKGFDPVVLGRKGSGGADGAGGPGGTGGAGGAAAGAVPLVADGGFGLTSMRQRLARVAGILEIETEPGAGTAVSASVPALAREVSRE
ncbi:sensor histidine kinase [Nocardiopsis akebiae]|uniref:Sensor histidine kinase n=1 Tax=Nocardiopsis akebiae TaxID=2831968 RepID=A0ABX8BZN6_9ACTN|nr:sensor histidine kinase [Nocardiopsis akebiae]QUX27634.1 sensor histidine kinase [Nocardiopsis akebiae]